MDGTGRDMGTQHTVCFPFIGGPSWSQVLVEVRGSEEVEENRDGVKSFIGLHYTGSRVGGVANNGYRRAALAG